MSGSTVAGLVVLVVTGVTVVPILVMLFKMRRRFAPALPLFPLIALIVAMGVHLMFIVVPLLLDVRPTWLPYASAAADFIATSALAVWAVRRLNRIDAGDRRHHPRRGSGPDTTGAP